MVVESSELGGGVGEVFKAGRAPPEIGLSGRLIPFIAPNRRFSPPPLSGGSESYRTKQVATGGRFRELASLIEREGTSGGIYQTGGDHA